MTTHNVSNRPNILMIVSHDLGSHFGPYGHARDFSPNLTRFAAEAMRFDAHFVSSSGCSQSRSSLVTGRYPHANGQFGLANWGWKLNEDEILLPAVLREHGYHSALIGIWHLHKWTLSAFDTISADVSTADRSPEGFAEVAAPRAVRWLEEHANENQPFYLHVGFWEVHRPFRENETDRAKISPASSEHVPDYLPNNESTRQEVGEFHSALSLVDGGLERILRTLDKKGMAENTLVIFTADHGLPFPRAKGTCYDPGIRVGLLARLPDQITAGSDCPYLTSNVDIMPTLLDFAGVPIPARVQGTSLKNLFLGNADGSPARDAIFAEKTYHEHYDPIRCVRTDQFKFIRNFASRPNLVLPSDVYNSPTRISITDDDAVWATRPTEELYDVKADSKERNNLVGKPEYSSTIDQLSSRLKKWMHDTGDPLIHGPITRQESGS